MDPLRRRGGDATGCDRAPAMTALARELNPDVTFDEASAEALPYGEAPFHVTVCAFGWGHFSDAEHVAAAFFRALRPGGKIALSL